MGRTFENRKQAMAKRSDRDAKAFTRAGRQLSIAVKQGGPDPEANPALRRAIQNARGVNMPKDRIQNAIDKASGAADTQNFEEILYEGYGPHGVALIVETATDNPTRTFSNVRMVFNKQGGNLGTSGSVAFLFQQLGVFELKPEGLDRDTLELELIDHGLEAWEDGEGRDGEPIWVLRTARENFGQLQAALDERKIEPIASALRWLPVTPTELTAEQQEDVLAFIEKLEQDDDVQQVYTNLA